MLLFVSFSEAVLALPGTVPSHRHTQACHLHEITSVDNGSDFDDLKGELDKYIPKYLVGKVKVIRNTKCEGLI